MTGHSNSASFPTAEANKVVVIYTRSNQESRCDVPEMVVSQSAGVAVSNC